MSDESEVEEVIHVPGEYAAFHDDIYGKIAEWMAETGLVDDPREVETLEIRVTSGESVVITDYETQEVSSKYEVDTV